MMLLINDLLEILKKKKLIGVDRKNLFSKNSTVRFRAKENLINNLVLKEFDYPELSTIKSLFVFTLLRLKRKESKISFGKELLKKSLKLEQFNVAFQVSQILLLYSTLEHKEHYKGLIKELLQKINLENEAIINYVNVLSGKELKDTLPVSGWSAFYHFFAIICYWEQRDDHKTIESCHEALNYFESNYPERTAAIKHVLLKSFVPVIRSKGSNETVLKYLSIEQKGTNNYLNACIYHAIYWSYKEDYHQSIQVCQEALEVAKTAAIREQLQIVEAWSSLMTDIDFKFSRFLNDLSIFTKQKSDANAGLILLKILYWIKKDETGKVIDAEISLKRYSRRYITGRMMTMYQLIFLLIKCSFDKKVFQKQSAELVEKIKTGTPLSIDIEIVPFDRVIEGLL